MNHAPGFSRPLPAETPFRVGDARTGDRAVDFWAWAFALHTARTLDGYDPMDLSLWRFWVLPRAVVAATGQKTLTLARVEALAGAGLRFAELATGLREAVSAERARGNDCLR